MNEYETYTMYLALQAHFSRDYDYFKYSGKINASVNSFTIRKDKYFFHRLSRFIPGEEMEFFLASNMVETDKAWIGNLLTPEAKAIYTSHKKIKEALKYHYSGELDTLFANNTFEELFKPTDKQSPEIVTKFQEKDISIETFSILAEVLGLYKVIDNSVDDEYIWPKIKHKSQKFYPFLHINLKEYKKITTDKLKEYYPKG